MKMEKIHILEFQNDEVRLVSNQVLINILNEFKNKNKYKITINLMSIATFSYWHYLMNLYKANYDKCYSSLIKDDENKIEILDIYELFCKQLLSLRIDEILCFNKRSMIIDSKFVLTCSEYLLSVINEKSVKISIMNDLKEQYEYLNL